MANGFTTGVHVRWSDIDTYQHINHATMVTLLEEARVDFLREPFAEDITTIGLLIHEVRVLYKGQLRLADSPLQVTVWTKRLRAVDLSQRQNVSHTPCTHGTADALVGNTGVGPFETALDADMAHDVVRQVA